MMSLDPTNPSHIQFLMALLSNSSSLGPTGAGVSSSGSSLFGELEYRISRELFDPAKAAAITNIYQQEYDKLGAIWPDFQSTEFRDFIVERARYLGGASVDHHDLFDRSLSCDFKLKFRQPEGYEARYEALNTFFETLKDTWGRPKSEVCRNTANKANIVVLTRSCGQGHNMPASAVERELKLQGHNATVINVGDIEKVSYSLFGGNTSMKSLRYRVSQLKPDGIISMVAHHSHWTQLAYDLNVPMRVAHTDYEVHEALCKSSAPFRTLCNFEDTSLVKYLLATKDSEQHRLELSERVGIRRACDLTREFGFPLRSSFERETRPQVLSVYRQELGFKENERVIPIIGRRKDEEPLMEKFIESILKSTRDFVDPICLVAVCGNNAKRKARIQSMIDRIPGKNPMVRVKIEGDLDQENYAKHMAIASRCSGHPGFFVGKSGGSSTAEAAAMGVYWVNMGTISNESCNEEYLARHNLGEHLESDNVVNQTSRLLKWNGKPDDVYQPTLDWKANLLREVEEMLTHRIFSHEEEGEDSSQKESLRR